MTTKGEDMQNESKRSLVKKLADVMGEVDRVPKSGRNEFHRYDYATEADIVAAVRAGLSTRGVMMLPNIVKTEWREIQRAKGGTERLCTLTVRFTFHDGDSGETLDVEVLGEGQDPGDKASYKAFTGATKYALLKTFLIPTGDDPEADEDAATKTAKSRPQMPQQPRPAPSRQPGEDDVDPISEECRRIVEAAHKATTQAELDKLKPRALALPKDSPEKKSASKALADAFGRIQKAGAA